MSEALRSSPLQGGPRCRALGPQPMVPPWRPSDRAAARPDAWRSRQPAPPFGPAPGRPVILSGSWAPWPARILRWRWRRCAAWPSLPLRMTLTATVASKFT